jgi:methyl coenzyme M reductase subunit D
VHRPSPRVDYTDRRKIKRKKENVPIQNSIGSALRSASTKQNKIKKNLFVLLCANSLPKGRLTERRKTTRKKENVPNQSS